MSFEMISLIILFLSFLGLIFFISKKISVLAGLPIALGADSEGFISKALNKIKGLPGIKSFSPDVFLQKIISQIRVLSLKTDHKTFSWLQKLREKTQKKKLEDENYWEEIKNSTDLKK